MRKFVLCITSILSFIFSTHANSQSLIDACKTIITDGLRDYSIETNSAEYLNSVRDQYCDSSSSAKSSKFGVGLDAVVEAIPIGFKVNYNSSQEAMRNFCKNYSAQAISQSD